MKHRAAGNRANIGQVLKYAAVTVAMLSVLSCAFGFGRSFWNTLLEKAGVAHFAYAVSDDELNIHILNVGKADAIIIESPEVSILVDTGTADMASTVGDYLKKRDIDTLDAVLISHGDSDHSGGLGYISDSVSVRELVHSPYFETDIRFDTEVIAKAGDTLRYGDISIEVMGPIRKYAEENDNSMVFRLSFHDFSMLFCGDIEKTAENDLINSGIDLSTDVLKVAHHGSNSSTSEAWLTATEPECAVISVGEDNNLLPRNSVLKRLSDAGVEVLRTDLDGSCVISTDGSNIKILTENTGKTTVLERSNNNEKNDN